LTTSPPTVVTTISGFSTPVAMAVSPNGQTVYVANKNSTTVTPIDTATNTAGTPIPAGTSPAGIAITPDGPTAYAAAAVAQGPVPPITLVVTPGCAAPPCTGTPIPVGSFPDGLAVTPDGQTVIVTDNGAGAISPISVATNVAGPQIKVGASPVAV